MKLKGSIFGCLFLILFLMMVVPALTGEDIFFPEDLLQDVEFINALENQLLEKFGAKFMYNEARSIVLIDELMSAFPQNRSGEIIYPEYFGGLYLDDNGNLTVLVVASEMDSAAYSGFLSVARGGDVNMRVVNFSHNALYDLMLYIKDIADSDMDKVFGIVDRWGVNVKDNTVTVRLIEYSQEQIDLFRNTIVDSPMLTFVQSGDPGH